MKRRDLKSGTVFLHKDTWADPSVSFIYKIVRKATKKDNKKFKMEFSNSKTYYLCCQWNVVSAAWSKTYYHGEETILLDHGQALSLIEQAIYCPESVEVESTEVGE